VPPFGFLKKKDPQEKESSDSTPGSASGSPEMISIIDAQNLLRALDSNILQTLVKKLEPIKLEVQNSLSTLSQISDEMEKEQIKLEDMEQRHRSVIENSRRTVISSLRREASAELLIPDSANDVKKFRERMDAMMKRFGEVSGSHSKLLNYFLKKHAAKMRREFEHLEALLGQTKSAITEFDSARLPVIKCTGLLNSIAQLSPGLSSLESAIDESQLRADQVKEETEKFKLDLDTILGTEDYSRAKASTDAIKDVEQKKLSLDQILVEQFSHVSRVIAKYSYGVDKETNRRLQLMTNEPAKVLENDLAPYLTLLSSIRSSVQNGSMQIKDGDRVASYIDELVRSLPVWQSKLSQLKSDLSVLLSEKNSEVADRANELAELVALKQNELSRLLQSIEQQKKQLSQRKQEIRQLIGEVEIQLSSITSRKYAINQ
jgi:hypothetical protein